MPLFLARVIIIVVILLVLVLLRKFIKRLIFLIVLLAVTFFIYGLFSPSGASKLRDKLTNFPQWLASSLSGEKIETAIIGEPTQPEIPIIDVDTQDGTDQPSTDQPSTTDKKSKKADKPAGNFSLRYPSRYSSLQFIKDKFPTHQPDLPSIPVEVEEGDEQWTEEKVADLETPESTWTETSDASASSSSSSTSTSSQGLTAQEIREAEKLFGLLLE